MDLVLRIRNYLHNPDSKGEFAEEARFLINHPVMIEAFERLENDLLVRFVNTESTQIDEREQIHQELDALKSLKGRLESFIYSSLINRSKND